MMRFDYREVARYLSDRSTPEERCRLEARLEKNPDYRHYFEHVQQIWHIAETPGIHLPGDDGFVAEDWAIVQSAMRPSVSPSQAQDPKRERRAADRSPRQRRGPGRLARHFAGAAVMLGVLVGGLWLATHYMQRDKNLPIASALQEVTTQPGQRARIPLGDGTIVRLNVASTIRFPEHFGNDKREVVLEGEAFFEVAEDAMRPFIVRAEGASVEVLGTAFNVRAYGEDPTVDVVVTRGKVLLHADDKQGDPVVLAVQEMGRLTRGRAERVTARVDTPRRLAWMEGRLVFKDTPFRDVAAELQRWYALEVTLEEGLVIADWRITATFTDESIDEILNIIAASLDVRYNRDRQTVTLYR